MISFLLNLATGLMTWLASVLPTSPFSGLSLATSGFATGIGWLNWFVPVGQMATMFGVWLVAAIVWQVVQYVMNGSTSVLSIFGKK